MSGCIEEIRIDDLRWDNIVRSTVGWDVQYLSDYVKAFCQGTTDEPVLFLYKKGEESAVNVLIKRDISYLDWFADIIEKNTYFDLVTPYGYGGYVGNVANPKEMLKQHQEYCAQKGYIGEVIKFNPLSTLIEYYNGVLEKPFKNVICDLRPEMEELWKAFKPKVRKNVKRAKEYGLKLVVDEEHKYLEEFKRIYYGTMDRNNATDNFYFKDSFFGYMNKLKENAVYFHVMYEDKIISTELILYSEEKAYSFLGGTDANYYEMRPNDFLKYEIMKWCKSRRIKYFVLGGGYGREDGIYVYKTSFAPNGIYDFCVGTNLFDTEAYQYLCQIRKKQDAFFDEKSRMFPAYRF